MGTKRKLKGPASVRGKGKKTKVDDNARIPESNTSNASALNSEAASVLNDNPETSMVKMELSALQNNDEDGMLDKMSMLEEDDDDTGLEPSLEQDNLDEEEDRALTGTAAVHGEEDEDASKVAAKKLQERVELLETEKKQQQVAFKELEAKMELLQKEKKDLVTKYQKYKEMSKDLREKVNSLSKNSTSNNSSIKELED